MQPDRLTLKAHNGSSLNVLQWSGVGPPVLLLHGVGNDATVWWDVAVPLARHARLWAVDLRGHGESGWCPDKRYSVDDHVRDLLAVMDQLGLGRASLVGHSLGGSVAVRLAAENATRVERIAIVDSGPRTERVGMEKVRRDLVRGPRVFSDREGYRRHLETLYPLASEERLERAVAHGLRTRSDGRVETKFDPEVSRRRSRGPVSVGQTERASERRWRELEAIRCPALVVRATASAMLARSTARRMAEEALEDGELVEISRSGHAVMMDNPEELAEVLERFLPQPGKAAQFQVWDGNP